MISVVKLKLLILLFQIALMEHSFIYSRLDQCHVSFQTPEECRDLSQRFPSFPSSETPDNKP